MPDFTPSAFVLQAHQGSVINRWGPFKSADQAADWATRFLDSGSGWWEIVPIWDPAQAWGDR